MLTLNTKLRAGRGEFCSPVRPRGSRGSILEDTARGETSVSPLRAKNTSAHLALFFHFADSALQGCMADGVHSRLVAHVSIRGRKNRSRGVGWPDNLVSERGEVARCPLAEGRVIDCG